MGYFNVFLINCQNDFCDNRGKSYLTGSEFNIFFIKKDLHRLNNFFMRELSLFNIVTENKIDNNNLSIPPCLVNTWGSMIHSELSGIINGIQNKITIVENEYSFLSKYKKLELGFDLKDELFSARYCLFAGEYLDKHILSTIIDYIEIAKKNNINNLPEIIVSLRYSSISSSKNKDDVISEISKLPIRIIDNPLDFIRGL